MRAGEEGALKRTLDRTQVLFRSDKLDRAAAELKHIDKIIAEAGANSETMSWVDWVRADILRAQDDATAASAALTRSNKEFLQVYPNSRDTRRGVVRRLAEAEFFIEANEFGDAKRIIQELRHVIRTTFDRDKDIRSRYWTVQGRASLNEYPETKDPRMINTAIDQLQAALRTYGTDATQLLASVHFELATAYSAVGNYLDAKGSAQEAIRIDTAIYGIEHREVARDVELLTNIKLLESLENGLRRPL